MTGIDYADYAEIADEIYGDTNPDCPGHEEVNSMYPNGRVVWCGFTEDCPEA